MKTINIHGKEYVEVNERIKYFRENFKDWALTGDIVRLETIIIKEKECLMCVFKSEVRNPEGVVKSTGTAYEVLGSTYINKTSFIENCETSANGRALGNLGIGIDTSIASADEVNLAISQKDTKPKKEKLKMYQYQAMISAIGEGKIDVVKERMKNYKITKLQKTTLDKLIKEQIEEINKTGDQEKKEEARFNSITEINEGLAATIREYGDLNNNQ
tara:strand:- start:980 stop:1627 length:648 start_codon:yes stop_codon:yes gene_type:complete